MVHYIREAPVEVRCHLIGSIFPEKIEFDGEKYRTSKMNEGTAGTSYGSPVASRENQKEKHESGTFFVSPIAVPAIEMQKEMSALSNKFEDTHLFSHLLSVPRVGLEPTQPFRAKGFSYKPKFAWTMS